MPPFRQPVSSDEEDSWSPPEYAKPVSDSSDKWEPPEYAKAIKEEKKPSEFKAMASKALEEFVSDVKSIPHSVNEGVKGVVSKALETPVIGRILKSQDPGLESVLPKSESLVKEPESYWGGFAKGLYENWARPLATATGVAGLLSGGEGESPEKIPERPSAVRSPRPLDYVNKSGEKSVIKPADIPLKADTVGDYIKKNPDAKMADVEEFIKSTQAAKTPAAEVPVKQTPKAVKEIPKDAELPKELQEYDKKQGMAQPLSDEELIKAKTDTPVVKQKTFNPFEKPKTAESSPEFETKPSESQIKQPAKPTAKYMYDWPDMATETQGPEQYQIEGGRLHGSSVGADTLRREGIEIPEKTAEAVKPQSRGAWKAPEYAKAVERTSEEDLTKGFGGSGHPESADYVSKVLSDAGKGDAGLKIEEKEGFKHIVYRSKTGDPVAAAKIVAGPDGKNMIQDIAADKSKGLLTGRAMKAIGDKLKELRATESSGTTSSDAQNFLAKMKDRMSKAADIKAPLRDLRDIKNQTPHGNWMDVEHLDKLPKAFGELKDDPVQKFDSPESRVAADKLKESINKEGIIQPIRVVVDDSGKPVRLSEGRHRIEALKDLRFKDAPVKLVNEAGTPLSFSDSENAINKLKGSEPEPVGIGARIKGFLKDEEGSARLPDEEEPDTVDSNARMQVRGESRLSKIFKPELLSPDQYTRTGDPNSPTFGNIKHVTPMEADPEFRAEMRSLWGNMSKDEISRYIELRSNMNRPLDKITPEMNDEFMALQAKKPGVHPPNQYLLKKQAEETRLKNLTESRSGQKALPEAKDDITEMHGGLGFTGSSTPKQPSTGPHGPVLDKFLSSLEESRGLNEAQQQVYKKEMAQRFANFAGVKEEGVAGAAKSLSKLKGQYEKIEPLYGKLQLEPQETDQLFTAVKKANITEGEKARGYTALFKLMNGESVPQRNELAILDHVFGNNFASRITEMHGGIGAVGLKVSKVANTMKSLQNSLSLAAPLRHGIGLVARKEFGPAFAEMFKYFAKPEYFNAAMDALESRPNYMLSREAGLFTAKPSSLMNSEEEFLNSYVGMMPGIRQVVGASQRGYTGFLNKLRSDTFDSMIKQAKALGHETATTVGDQVVPSKETKAIARYINNATGRGDLPGGLNKLTNELNVLLWSPRMISSRINMLANPKIYTDLPKGMRLEGLKSLLGIAALGTAIDTLGAYGGAKVSTNILSTDFGKSRFGKDVIDPWGGFQQYIVGAARFLAGKTNSNTPTSRLEIAGRFLANKESPAASLAHTLLTAKKFTGKSDDPATAGNFTTQYGEKTNIQSEIGKRFTPIFIQDLEDLMKNEPDWSENVGLNTAMAGASLAGMSQNYKEKKSSKLGLGSMKLGR